jgi:hypothetical protein
MVPGKYDMTIYRGSTFSLSFTAADANDVPVDFDADYIDKPGADLGDIRMYIRPAWAIRPETTKQDALLELTIANGRITTAGTTLTITLTAAETAAITFNEGKYDIELVTGAAIPVVDKLLYGKVTVKDEQTA